MCEAHPLRLITSGKSSPDITTTWMCRLGSLIGPNKVAGCWLITNVRFFSNNTLLLRTRLRIILPFFLYLMSIFFVRSLWLCGTLQFIFRYDLFIGNFVEDFYSTLRQRQSEDQSLLTWWHTVINTEWVTLFRTLCCLHCKQKLAHIMTGLWVCSDYDQY